MAVYLNKESERERESESSRMPRGGRERPLERTFYLRTKVCYAFCRARLRLVFKNVPGQLGIKSQPGIQMPLTISGKPQHVLPAGGGGVAVAVGEGRCEQWQLINQQVLKCNLDWH